jgi:hypothetical protein
MADGVAWGVGPEFKPQCWKKKRFEASPGKKFSRLLTKKIWIWWGKPVILATQDA